MKIITYNVNGLRSALSKGFTDWLTNEQPDIVCLQETKAQPDQIPTLEFEMLGYHSYFSLPRKKAIAESPSLQKIFRIGSSAEWECLNTMTKVAF